MRAVIPTYQRSREVVGRTLYVLSKYGWPANEIDLWVADEFEYEVYKHFVPEHLYRTLHVGVPGLPQQRDFIARAYGDGQHLLSLDDDLLDIVPKYPDAFTSLWDWAKRAFSLAEKVGVSMWGVYPGGNKTWMQGKPRLGWVTLVGPMFGLIVDYSADHQLTHLERGDIRCNIEDAYRSARMFSAEGACLRLDDLGIEHRWYGNPGGVAVERNIERVYNAAVAIANDYPSLYEVVWRPVAGQQWPELHEKKLPNRKNLI